MIFIYRCTKIEPPPFCLLDFTQQGVEIRVDKLAPDLILDENDQGEFGPFSHERIRPKNQPEFDHG